MSKEIDYSGAELVSADKANKMSNDANRKEIKSNDIELISHLIKRRASKGETSLGISPADFTSDAKMLINYISSRGYKVTEIESNGSIFTILIDWSDTNA